MLCFFYMINFPSLTHSILSSTGEISEEIFGWLKEYFKGPLVAPQPAQWDPGNCVIVTNPIVVKGSPALGHVATSLSFFFNGVSLTFENYQLLSLLKLFSLNFSNIIWKVF